MPTRPVAREECLRSLETVKQALKEGYVMRGIPSAITEAAERLNVNRRRIEHHLRVGAQRYGLDPLGLSTSKTEIAESTKRVVNLERAKAAQAEPKLPDFPDDDIPDEHIIDMMCSRYTKRAEHRAS